MGLNGVEIKKLAEQRCAAARKDLNSQFYLDRYTFDPKKEIGLQINPDGNFNIITHDQTTKIDPFCLIDNLDLTIGQDENGDLWVKNTSKKSSGVSFFHPELGTDFQMEDQYPYPAEEAHIEVEDESGRDFFYHIAQSTKEPGKVEVERETVRPQFILKEPYEDSKDFYYLIDINGFINLNGHHIRGYFHNLVEGQQLPNGIEIAKNGKKVTVNGKRVRGDRKTIQLGNEIIHLVQDNDSWELLNDAVYQVWEKTHPEKKPLLSKWNVSPSEWFKSAAAATGKEAKKIFEQGIKPRGWKDAFALIARVVSDTGLPGAWALGLGIMGINLSTVAIKEFKTRKKFGSFKDYFEQTSFGRLATGQTESGLSRDQRASSLFFGAGVGGLFMMVSEAAAKIIPGGSISRYFLSRALFGYVAPEIFALIGEKVIGKATGDQEKAKEWLSLTLGTMSATITGLSALMFLGEGGVKLIEQKIAEVRAEATATATVAAATATVTATAVEASTTPVANTATAEPPTTTPIPPTQTVTPTETLPPTQEFSWHFGEAVDKTLLQHAADNNHGWGVDINHDGQAEFQVFWLDQSQGPDVIIDSQQNHFIRGDNNLFYLDADKNGLLEGNELRGAWDISSLNPELKSLDNITQESVPLQNLIDINATDVLANAGKVPGLAAPLPVGVESSPVPPIIDLNGDGAMDINVDAKGQFADNNYDGVFTQGIDTRIEKLDFDTNSWQMNKIVYADGSMWTRNDDGDLVGILPDGRTIRLDDSSGTSRLQVLIHKSNPAWSPQFVGEQAVINPTGIPIPPAPPTPVPPPNTSPEVINEPVRGDWGTMTKANGDEVYLDAARGGIHGVVQNEMHLLDPNLSPEEVTVMADRLVHYGVDHNIDAFKQPVGGGQAVLNSIQNDSTMSTAFYQFVAAIYPERFLITHADWLSREGIHLSDHQRFEVALRAINQWSGWLDDDDKKDGLLAIAKAVIEEDQNE